MAKTHRGRNLKKEFPKAGRGACPITGRTGVKLLYEYEENGKKLMISKSGRAKLENARRNKAKMESRASRKAETAIVDAVPTVVAPVAATASLAEEQQPQTEEATQPADPSADTVAAEPATVSE